ncbi:MULTISPECIES: hypothetical protein [unclassified Candidatus Tisiphia]|uniref:hypothetical protein n=1 Tax=unclassified Candidatus Tisiphia TaxID=2996318 RepID=UPI00312C85E2
MRIRDFIKDNIAYAEELVEYKEFRVETELLSANVTLKDNGCLSQVTTLKRIQKFILHNGQERLFHEETKTVCCDGALIISNHFSDAGNSESKIFTPLNNALNVIAPILDIIPEITSYQNSNSSYITQNS